VSNLENAREDPSGRTTAVFDRGSGSADRCGSFYVINGVAARAQRAKIWVSCFVAASARATR
jgi:hypothetical protein